MDYLKYVNSKDIKNYLKEIDYKPTSTEVAWLIYRSFKTTREKHLGYKKLITEMPDMEIDVEGFLNPNDSNSMTKIHYDSLHEFLIKYMEAENKLEEVAVSGGKDSIYIMESINFNGRHAYRSFEDCVDGIKKSFKSRDIPWQIVRLEARTGEIEYIDFVIMGGCFDHIEGVSFRSGNSEIEKIYSTFGMMDFFFPVPFKKGDILQRVLRDASKCNSDPRVFMTNKNEEYSFAEVLRITNKRRRKEIIKAEVSNILDYEYAEDNITCEQRDMDFLNSVSNYLKHGSIGDFLHAYREWLLKELLDTQYMHDLSFLQYPGFPELT